MTDIEKKEGALENFEKDPASPTIPVLPTVNPAIEKKVQESAANKIHPAFYVM